MKAFVVRITAALGIIVGTSCGTGQPEPITVKIPPENIAGCRAPTAGCEVCCAATSSGYELHSSMNADFYNVTSFNAGPCPSDKPTCARCSDQAEQDLRMLAAEPVCECAGVDPGIDPCESRGCACFCARLGSVLQQCTAESI